MPPIRLLSVLAPLIGVTATGPAAADGLPDVAFGVDGFVRYEHSTIEGEPNIERGLRVGRLPDGDLVVLAQHRYQDADALNYPLIVTFTPGGALRRADLFGFGVSSPPDPPITATDFDPDRRALFIGESAGGFQLDLFGAAQVAPGSNFVPTVQASIPNGSGQGDAHRTLVGTPDGGIVACGLRQMPFGAASTGLPLCRRFTSTGAIDASFGNASPFAPPGTFLLSELDLPGLQAGRVVAAGLDRQGRLLLGGLIRLEGVAADLAFSARLLAQGVFDPDYCAASACTDAAASAPGWRADLIADARDYVEGALIERPDGAVARVYDVTRIATNQPQVAFTLHAADGALMHVDTLQLGEWTRVGSQLGVLSDNRVMLPLSFRPDASTQLGALARVSAQPAADGLFDPTFTYAPVGVTPLPGVSVIRPSIAGLPSTSAECNAVWVDTDRLTCAGLVRVGSAPVNVDLLLARVRIVAPEPVFDDGFE